MTFMLRLSEEDISKLVAKECESRGFKLIGRPRLNFIAGDRMEPDSYSVTAEAEEFKPEEQGG